MKRCPICRKDMTPEWEPFCSKRCKQVDLGRWFTGSYVIPTVEGEDTLPEDNET